MIFAFGGGGYLNMFIHQPKGFNPLNAKLNPISHLLALL